MSGFSLNKRNCKRSLRFFVAVCSIFFCVFFFFLITFFSFCVFKKNCFLKLVPNVLSCLVCQNFLFFCKVLLSRLSMRMIKYFGSCCFGLSRQISALWLQIYQIISKFWIKRTKIINLRLFFLLLWYFKNCQLCAIQTLVANLTVLI